MSDRLMIVTVFAPDASGRVPAYPTVQLTVGSEERVLPPVLDAVASQLGISRVALELFVPGGLDDAHEIPALLVLEPAGVPAAGDTTLPAPVLDPVALPAAIRERAAGRLRELSGADQVPDLRPEWARPGWTARATDWLDLQLARAGRPRIGPVHQQRTWSLSTLSRAETSMDAVWLKACMPRFHAEPPLGHWLSERFPDAVPGVLALDRVGRLLLLEEMDGLTVKDAGGEETAPDAPAVLARIALALAGRVADLRALGLQDRPLAQVPALLRPVLLGPDPVATGGLTPHRSRAVLAWVEREAVDLGRLAIEPTLVHGDFHAGNVARHRGRLRVFDWSDAVIGHPLMDAAAWIGEAPDDQTLAARWEAWVDAWSGRVASAELRPRLHQVLGVGAAHQLISLDGILRAMEPALRHTLAFSAIAYAAILDRLVPRA